MSFNNKSLFEPFIILHENQFLVIHEKIELIRHCEKSLFKWFQQYGIDIDINKTKIMNTLFSFGNNSPGFDFLGFFFRQYKKNLQLKLDRYRVMTKRQLVKVTQTGNIQDGFFPCTYARGFRLFRFLILKLFKQKVKQKANVLVELGVSINRSFISYNPYKLPPAGKLKSRAYYSNKSLSFRTQRNWTCAKAQESKDFSSYNSQRNFIQFFK